MSAFLNRQLAAITGILLVAVSFTVHAQTLEQLLDSDRLRINSWIEPSDNIIARQQISLYIEIATDKSFSGGTRIGRFEIDDAIVLQREQFAVNATRSEHGKSWTVQLWTLVIYPQRDGVFEIPAIPLRLSIAGEGSESIVGESNTAPLDFTAQIPAELQGKTSWIATTRFEVKESFNKSLDELKPGDALIRTINMSASDLPAMMLPEYTAGTLPGMAIYQKPPEVMDWVNRGEYLAGRTEILTYVFEQSGDYQLPAQTYYWWNLKSQKMESVELPAHILSIGSSNLADSNSSTEHQSAGEKQSIDTTLLLKYAGVTLIILLSIWIIVRKFYSFFSNSRFSHPSMPSEFAMRRQFEKACSQNSPEKAIPLFYKWLDNYGGDRFQGSIRQNLGNPDHAELATVFDRIMQTVYAQNDEVSIDLKKFSVQFKNELEKLDRPYAYSRWNIELRLN